MTSKGEQLMTVREIANEFRINPQTIYKLIRERKIEVYEVGGQYRIDPSQFRRKAI